MFVISVDVGSGSVRVAIIQFNSGLINDKPIANSSQSITVYNPRPDYYEQNSDEIWAAVCNCIQECISISQISRSSISGIAFSATCSLVIVEQNKLSGDVIMWMDHRANSEAQYITQTNHQVLQQFGGICSPEFTLSKLLWLKRNQNDRFNNALAFMELPDWLSWKCSQFTLSESIKDFSRSVCSVCCKWGYDSEQNRWRDDLFQLIGLNEFVKDKTKIGGSIVAPGKHIGFVSKNAAKDFGLITNLDELKEECIPISIASPIIDAHSGALAMLTFSSELEESSNSSLNYDSLFCMIAGTSTCHFISTRERQFTRGVWGPYYNVIFPNYYVREAGQSSTGKLIEHIIRTHPEYEKKYKNIPIENVIKELNAQISSSKNFKNKLHINPCFHGNRSPLANPFIRGAVYGLTLEANSLLDYYKATIEALAYETKFILEELRIPNLKKVLISGGLAKNEVYMQTHADVLNIEVITFSAGEADLMLVGAAILAHHSALQQDLTQKIIKYPQLEAKRYKPINELQKYHNLKYKCFRKLLESSLELEKIMEELN